MEKSLIVAPRGCWREGVDARVRRDGRRRRGLLRGRCRSQIYRRIFYDISRAQVGLLGVVWLQAKVGDLAVTMVVLHFTTPLAWQGCYTAFELYGTLTALAGKGK
jgi:hypothetical protein